MCQGGKSIVICNAGVEMLRLSRSLTFQNGKLLIGMYSGFGSAFSRCYNLSSVNIGDLNIPSSINTNDAFAGCISLKEVILSGAHRSFNLNGSPIISRESAVELLSSLPTLPENASNNSITFHYNTYFSLSEADKQIATDKNWIVTR